MHLPLAQHAWTVIRHPAQANLQAARHNIDAFVQVEIESVTGTVWHHQRRRRAATRYRDPTTTTETAEQNASAADGSYGQRRPSEEANPRTPCTTSASTLGGSLQHMCNVQWEPVLNAPVVDNNPLVANIAREAAGETLSSFGAGASADMIQALATWLVRHVRNRRATRAPNHWCWSITTVCWLISRAMRHNGNEQGLSVRFLASHFGMNAAGMRQRPIATWEQGGTTCAYAFDPGTLPPGAQSLGEHEGVVSHTNPRVSRAAVTLLDRLVQAIWTEPFQADPRNQGSSDEPHTGDAAMQVDNEDGSERIAMTIDRAPGEVPANTPASTGVADEGHENGSTYPPMSQCDAEEAQEGRKCRDTESPLEDGHAETQASNTVEPDEHWMGGTVHAQSAATSVGVDNSIESEGISPTVPFTHPDVSSTMGEGGEDALGSTPWPDHTEEGNGRLNATEDTNYTADENRTGHVRVQTWLTAQIGSPTQNAEANPDTTTLIHTPIPAGAVATLPTITQEPTYLDTGAST